MAWFGPATATLSNKNLSAASNVFPTSLVTLTGAQTLTNKTIDGSKNTLTKIPPSAGPLYSRQVWKSKGTFTGQWTRIAVYTPRNSSDSVSLVGVMTAQANGQALFAANFGPGGGSWIQFFGSHGKTGLGTFSLKLVSNGGLTPVELWLQADNTGYTYVLTELGLYAMVQPYDTHSTFTATEPVGSAVNVLVASSEITAADVPVVTTTGAQSLSNKTLVSPTLSGSPVVNNARLGGRVSVPATATTASLPGNWAADATYIYAYTGDGTTHSWVRSAAATW